LGAGAKLTFNTPQGGVLQAGDKARNYYGLKDYYVGLQGLDQIRVWYQGVLGRGFGAVQENPIGSAAGRVHLENVRQVGFQANTASRLLNEAVEEAFHGMNDSGQIVRLAGIDETMEGAAPTIQDVAARLPRFWDHLTGDEQQVMLRLQDFALFHQEILAESGSHYIPMAPRADIVSDIVRTMGDEVVMGNNGEPLTGFYLHRGHARFVRERMFVKPGIFKGIEIPRAQVQIGTYGGRAPAFTQNAPLASMGQAIQGIDGETYRYPHFRSATGDYVSEIGQSINKAMESNHYLNLINPETGELYATHRTKLIDPKLRAKIKSLGNRISGGNARLKAVFAQSKILSEHLLDSERAYAAVQIRREDGLKKAADRVRTREKRPDNIQDTDLNRHLQVVLEDRTATKARTGSANHELYQMLRESLETLFVAENQVRTWMQTVRVARKLELPADRAMVDSLRELDAVKSWMVKDLEEAEQAFDEGRYLWDEATTLQGYMDELTHKTGGMINNWEDLHAQSVKESEGLVTAQTLESAAKDGVVDVHRMQLEQFRVEHELRVMKTDLVASRLEQRRLSTLFDRELKIAGTRVDRAAVQEAKNYLNMNKIKERVDAAETELSALSTEWLNAVKGSKQAPQNQSIIPLPGLGGYYWPDTIAQAARKYLQQDPTIAGSSAGGMTVIQNFNSIYRATRGTLDNSAMWVHLLLRFYDNPSSWQRVMRLTFQAWGVPLGDMGVVPGVGERAIDSFFRNFDDVAVWQSLVPTLSIQSVEVGGKISLPFPYSVTPTVLSGLLGMLLVWSGLTTTSKVCSRSPPWKS